MNYLEPSDTLIRWLLRLLCDVNRGRGSTCHPKKESASPESVFLPELQRCCSSAFFPGPQKRRQCLALPFLRRRRRLEDHFCWGFGVFSPRLCIGKSVTPFFLYRFVSCDAHRRDKSGKMQQLFTCRAPAWSSAFALCRVFASYSV
ncbi:hypothetical protein TGPRC2_309180, partial [Toxoplasma gondii TgCatPRC2]